METVVHYEDWQMQCCGIPFAVGEPICWPVLRCEGEPLVDVGVWADWYYEAHGSDGDALKSLSGTVTAIRAVYYTYELVEGNPRFWRPVSGILVPVERAAGWEPARPDGSFGAYLVWLKDAVVEDDSGLMGYSIFQ